MSLSLPACPPSLKSIQHFLKIAAEHDTRDPVVAYWARLTALQSGLAIDKSSKEALAVLLPLMDWLEKEKGNNKENDAIANEVCNVFSQTCDSDFLMHYAPTTHLFQTIFFIFFFLGGNGQFGSSIYKN